MTPDEEHNNIMYAREGENTYPHSCVRASAELFAHYQLQKLFPSLGLIECAAEITCGGQTALLLHSSHLHAHVLSLHHHHHSQRMQGFLYAFPYLLGHAFLYLQASGKAVHHTRYLTQASDLTIGNVCHMYASVEGKHVMFAK